MERLDWTINPYNDDKVMGSCALFGMMNLKGERFSSKIPIHAISVMRERYNGLGGGFACLLYTSPSPRD